jgi:hypothetical protein
MVGYDELSELIGSYPELAIFRKFGPLSAQVLLSLQAELMHIQEDLELIAEHEREHPDRADLSRSWAKMNAATSLRGADARKNKIAEAKSKLETYCTSSK